MTKHFVRATLTKVTGWTLEYGDSQKTGDFDKGRYRAEVKARLEDCTDDGREHLPFVYEFTVPGLPTRRKVHDALIEEFASQFYKNDYVFPTDGEFTWETLKTYEED